MNKVKNSLVVQTSFLFFISFIVIVILWIFFYLQQKYQHVEYDTSRYFNTASSLQPLLYANQPITNSDVEIFSMKIYTQTLPLNTKVLWHKGNKKKGFSVFRYESNQILYIYNQKSSITLKDISTHRSMIAIHMVFMLLLMTQVLLYMKLKKSLTPLSLLHNKLKKLEVGDLSPLEIQSEYEEIQQMVFSYNESISKIEHILELREMFNKIFMHEMKMPLAKGMFYLKQEPSAYTHEKLSHILYGLNNELNEFSQIEMLIANQEKITTKNHLLKDIIQIATSRVLLDEKNIIIKECNNCQLRGDKEFWILCVKNLIDNALKYSYDKKLIIECSNEGISFMNQGDELPVDISNDIKKWTIDKNKRHKSSTGYGFGLFIIKNIVTLHQYKLTYDYDDNNRMVILRIV